MLVGLYLGGLVLARENDPVFYIGFGVVLLLLGAPAPRSADACGGRDRTGSRRCSCRSRC